MDVGSFWGTMALGPIKSIMYYSFWGLVLALIVGGAWKWHTDKKVFKNPVRIFRLRQNGQTKELNTRGGYIINKKRVAEFWIKVGKFKKRKMDSLPDPKMIDFEDRVYYFQTSPLDYSQTEVKWNYEPRFISNVNYRQPTLEESAEIIRKWAFEMMGKDKELKEPEAMEKAERMFREWDERQKGERVDVGTVNSNPLKKMSKEAVINDIIIAKQVLGVDVNKQFMYFVSGVIALVVLGIVVFYIASNEGHMPFLEFAPLIWMKKRFK